MQRRLAVLLAILAALGATAVLVAVPAASVSTTDDQVPVTTPSGFDESEFTFTVTENASARWTISHVRQLENESQVSDFEAYAAEFNSARPKLATDFENRSLRLVEDVSSSLGRPMAAENFAHVAEVRQFGGARGVVELSFTWTNFARESDGQLVVADVFGGGMYVGQNQELLFETGPNLTFAAVEPDPGATELTDDLAGSGWLSWQGPQDFNHRHPRVVFESSDGSTPGGDGAGAGAGDGSGAGDGTGDGDESGSSGAGLLGLPGLAILFLLAIVVAVGAAWYADALPAVPGGGGSTSEGAGGAAADSVPVESTDEPESAGEPAVSDEELLSDEDRVVSLLEENGGRMKQVNIVEQTEWSKSKVSMLLSEMEDEGEISKLRVGRENIVSLAGHEPEAAGSPFEEE